MSAAQRKAQHYHVAIPSVSLGRAWLHDLDEKVSQAAWQGFEGIEIFYEDLEYAGRSLAGGDPSDNDLLRAAEHVKGLCDAKQLQIIALQPFLFYEGLLDRNEHAKKIEKVKLWFQLAKALGTDTIQIPSNFMQDGISGDRDLIVRDMTELADLGLQETPVIRFVYENLCWGTYIDTWEGAWEIVSQVDRQNFGICLDTFNIAGRVWADPEAESGKTVNADDDLRASLQRLKETVDVNKVFYVQVVDAEKLSSPLLPGHAYHVDGQPARMSWSRNARVFPFEEPGYLPILDVLKAITDDTGLGFKGWISLELFSRTLAYEESSVPRSHAERGMQSWERLKKYMAW